MSDIIRLLPDSIANQIAAGEVIQRPASVVKELLENAVDAGAKKIQLIIKDSGKTLVQVIDDGSGMSETDARMSFERHATSKIQESADLFRIKTMGFRGEALASIAAVAMVELITKTDGSELGCRILMQGSVLQKQEYCSSQGGTNISVKKLFYNTPARRKFLKSDPVEFRHILEEYQRVALANSDISFSLHHNEKEISRLPASNLRKRVIGVFGKNTNEKLVPIHEETEAVTISGFVGKPESSKKTRGEQYFFVNNRFFKSPYLHHSVLGAYENLILPGHHPLYALFFEMPPENVDVNVHPTKQEIKFQDERLIYHYLKVSIRHALGKFSVIPSLSFESGPAFLQKSQSSRSDERSALPTLDRYHGQEPKSTKNWDSWEKLYEDAAVQASAGGDEKESQLINPSWDQSSQMEGDQHLPFQIHNKFVLSPIKSGFLLIHQHYAHCRILFEKFIAVREGGQVSCQKLLFPETIHLQTADAQLLQSCLDDLRGVGFDLDLFGQDAFIVHGLPGYLSGERTPQQWLASFLEIYKSEENGPLQMTEKLAWSLAKPAAIKSGQRLSVEEMSELIDGLFACEHPYRTPKGGLCFIQYSLETIERQFKS